MNSGEKQAQQDNGKWYGEDCKCVLALGYTQYGDTCYTDKTETKNTSSPCDNEKSVSGKAMIFSEKFDNAFLFKCDKYSSDTDESCSLSRAYFDFVAFKALNDRFTQNFADEIYKQFVEVSCKTIAEYNDPQYNNCIEEVNKRISDKFGDIFCNTGLKPMLFIHHGDEMSIHLLFPHRCQVDCFISNSSEDGTNSLAYDAREVLEILCGKIYTIWKGTCFKITRSGATGSRDNVMYTVAHITDGEAYSTDYFYLSGLYVRFGVGSANSTFNREGLQESAKVDVKHPRDGFNMHLEGERGIFNSEVEISFYDGSLELKAYRMLDTLVIIASELKGMTYRNTVESLLRKLINNVCKRRGMLQFKSGSTVETYDVGQDVFFVWDLKSSLLQKIYTSYAGENLDVKSDIYENVIQPYNYISIMRYVDNLKKLLANELNETKDPNEPHLPSEYLKKNIRFLDGTEVSKYSDS